MQSIGRFKVISELGRGAMGAVFLAEDPLIGRSVALKTVDPTCFASDRHAKERFLREARAAGRLNHPNIVTVFDVGEAGSEAFIVMELVEGRTLTELIAAGDPLPAHSIADIVGQVAEALDFAHTRGVVHRDIKPSNIMLNGRGTVKITDFGIARLEDTSRTRTGVVVGSPRYMSPEQVIGSQVDGRSDIFSLGTVMYELCTGRRPFGHAKDVDLLTLMEEIVRGTPVRASLLNPHMPKAFGLILERALAKDPDERYPRAALLANEVRNYKAREREINLDATVTMAIPDLATLRASRSARVAETPAAAIAFDLAALERDLDSFSVSGLQAEPGRAADAAPVAPREATDPTFPKIALEANSGEARRERAAEGALPLLERLRRDAEVAERSAAPAKAAEPERTHAARELDRELRAAFAYLHEFTKLVGIAKPVLGRTYTFLTWRFEGLRVAEAFVDYRTMGPGEQRLMESITLTLVCTSPGEHRLEREAHLVQSLVARLAECALRYTMEEIRNERQALVSAVLRVLGEVRIAAKLVPDYERGRIGILCRNVEGFGLSAFSIAAGALARETLDELGSLLLGLPSRFAALAERESGVRARRAR
ncbi:MAG: serine/threonine protein kinase [Burkholderiales bacterium]|nr:serine/threonine protein kinase [Burkholderiales bacterium]